jgi:hypothetical protein
MQEVSVMSQGGIADKENSNMIKDPEDWVTGDEEMTGAQRSYLQTLCEEAGEEFDPNLTKAEASKRIDELQQQTGRGIDH